MSQWVRLWDDMPTDPKWRTIATRCRRSIAEVMAVFVFMMSNAAKAAERGSLSGWYDEDVATALDIECEAVCAIREAMQGKTLDGDKLRGWDKRQPNDFSTDRVRQFRERVKRDETAGNGAKRPEEKRLDTEKKEKEPRVLRADFEKFYSAYPKKVNRQAAVRKFEVAVKSGVDADKIVAAAKAYAEACRAAKTEIRFIKGPDSWLHSGCYDDEFGTAAGRLLETQAVGFWAVRDSPEWDAWSKHLGKTPISDAKGGWRFPSRWPQEIREKVDANGPN